MENMLPAAAALGYATALTPAGIACTHGTEPKARWPHGMGWQPGKLVQIRSSSVHREIKKLNKLSRKPPSTCNKGQEHLQHLLAADHLSSSANNKPAVSRRG